MDAFILSFIITLILFIVIQPKQGHNPRIGFNLVLNYRSNYCFHIHHWVYMILLAIITIVSIFLLNIKGKHNTVILVWLGFLLGGSASDLVYTDVLEFLVKCNK